MHCQNKGGLLLDAKIIDFWRNFPCKSTGIEMIAPHKSNRVRPRTQDGRRQRRYERRWLVERFFAWLLQWQRRLLVRWEYYAENFLGFVQLATISILLKQF